MIQWLTSRTGESIPTIDGITLASMVDPLREAKSWVSAQTDIARGLRSLFVLGIGAGCHLVELSRAFPDTKILGVDIHRELVEKFSPHSVCPNLTVKCFQTRDEIFSDLFAVALLKNSYGILRHSPSLRVSPSVYKDLDFALRGRDRESLTRIAELRGIRIPVLPQFEEEKSTLSILDIYSGMSRGQVPAADRMIWNTVRELVK